MGYLDNSTTVPTLAISSIGIDSNEIESLVKSTLQRGKDASGLMYYDAKREGYIVERYSDSIIKLLKKL